MTAKKSVRTQSWTTKHELKFLSLLGSFSENPKRVGRKEMLEGYLVAADKRYNWAGISKTTCIAHAKTHLAAMGRT